MFGACLMEPMWPERCIFQWETLLSGLFRSGTRPCVLFVFVGTQIGQMKIKIS